MNIFERASRNKTRFASRKGNMTTEDLWSLSLQDLDTIAKATNKQLKAESEESFIEQKTTTASGLELQLDILKHVIKSKLSDKEAALKRAETLSRKEVLEDALAQKKVEEIKGKSVEELQKELAAIG